MTAKSRLRIQLLLENPFENYKRLSELFIWSLQAVQPKIQTKPYANISCLQNVSSETWERVISTLFLNLNILGVQIEDHLKFNEKTRKLEFIDEAFGESLLSSGI